MNTGDGTFHPKQDYVIDTIGDWYTNFVTVGDVNADGALDIVATNYHGFSVLLNNGSGSFTKLGDTNVSGTYRTIGLAIADLDGDDHADILVSVGTSSDGRSIFPAKSPCLERLSRPFALLLEQFARVRGVLGFYLPSIRILATIEITAVAIKTPSMIQFNRDSRQLRAFCAARSLSSFAAGMPTRAGEAFRSVGMRT